MARLGRGAPRRATILRAPAPYAQSVTLGLPAEVDSPLAIVVGQFGSALPARIAESTGTTFYVNDETGSDARTAVQAQSTLTPWKTVQKAIDYVRTTGPLTFVGGARIRVAGDTAAGAQQTYAETITFDITGDATHVCTIEGYGTNRPRVLFLAGAGVAFQTVTAGQYGRLRNFELKGIAHSNAGGNVLFWGNGGHHFECDGVEAWGGTCNSTSRWSSFYADGGHHYQWWNCKGHSQCADGVGTANQSHGWYVSTDQSYLVQCLAYNNRRGFGAQAFGGIQNDFGAFNCVFAYNANSGLVVSRTIDNATLRNCIAKNNGLYGIEANYETADGSNQTCQNCITHGNGSGGIGINGTSPMVASGNSTADPLLVDPTTPAFNFRPQAGSPAIAFGDGPTTPSSDIAGAARITGDAGAYAAGAPTVVPVGLAIEADTAPAAVPGVGIPVGLAQEGDAALAPAPVIASGRGWRPLGWLGMFSRASANATVAVGLAVESDQATAPVGTVTDPPVLGGVRALAVWDRGDGPTLIGA